MTDEDPKLVERAEKLVAELPLVEPEWEAFASRIEKEALLPPATDESLFDTPALQAEPGESREPALLAAAPAATAEQTAPSQREPVSLADLARATVAKRSSSERASIAKESLSLAAQRRAQSSEVAERVQQAGSAPGARQAITIPPARVERLSDSRGIWIGVGIAAIGLAASFGVYLTAEREKETIIVNGAPMAQAPAGPAPQAGPGSPGKPSSVSSDTVAEAPRGVSLDALARESEATASRAPVAAGTPGAATPVAKPARAPAAGGAVRPEPVLLDEDRTKDPVPPAELAARPPASAALKPAELGRDSGAADRPSAGAAQAAVGAVLGAARSCIAGHPRPSSATLVFGSSGEVSAVSVAGEAAGTPAAGCIESALKKARVQPFAAPTFSLSVTVRPP